MSCALSKKSFFSVLCVEEQNNVNETRVSIPFPYLCQALLILYVKSTNVSQQHAFTQNVLCND